MSHSDKLAQPAMSASTMQGAERLIGRLVSSGVDLSVEADDIVFSGPVGALDKLTLDTLRREKHAVLSMLAQSRARGVLKLGATSWEQRRMEWRNRVDSHAATYNVCNRFEFRGVVDLRSLARAAVALTERYKILRTRFVGWGEHLLQEVMAPPRSVIEVAQPTGLGAVGNSRLDEWCMRRGAAPFALGSEAPVRWSYVQIAGDQAILLVTLHHIACDGWSIERLLNDFRVLYLAEVRREEATGLPSVAITPSDFARWEMDWLTQKRIEKARAFWTAELAGAELTPIFIRSRGPVAPGGEAGCVSRSLSAAVAARITSMSRSLALTEFSLYFAAFAMLLQQETSGGDCAVVIAVANRTRPEHEELVALTRNAQPVRCSVIPGDTIETVARRISARVEHAAAYQWFPIGLIEIPDGDTRTSDMRRLPVTFGFEGPSDATRNCSQLSASMHNVYLGAARAEFSLLVRRHADSAEAFVEYSKGQFSSQDAELMTEKYVRLTEKEAGWWYGLEGGLGQTEKSDGTPGGGNAGIPAAVHGYLND